MKKILICGGTGFIGKKLIEASKRDNYYVMNISRDAEKSRKELPMVDEHLEWTNDADNLKSVINKTDVVINLSGASLAERRWTKKYKKIVYDSRINTTRAIANAINICETPPKVFINASAVGYYGNQGDDILNEESENGKDFLAMICRDWEIEALKAKGRTRVVMARTGVVLDKNNGALVKMMMPYKFYFGGVLGSGRQWMPWIHVDDVVEIFKFIIENERVSGAVNLCVPEPVRMGEFSKILGKVLGKPAFFNVPEFVLKIIMGEISMIVLEGQRAVPEKLLGCGYGFKFGDLEGALRDLLG